MGPVGDEGCGAREWRSTPSTHLLEREQRLLLLATHRVGRGAKELGRAARRLLDTGTREVEEALALAAALLLLLLALLAALRLLRLLALLPVAA